MNKIRKINEFVSEALQTTTSHVFDWKVTFEDKDTYFAEVVYLCDILGRIEKMSVELIFSDDEIIHTSERLCVLMHPNENGEWESTTELPDERSFRVGCYEWVDF